MRQQKPKDSIRQYLEDIGKIPLLTPEEEIKLGRRVRRWQQMEEEIKAEMATGVERWQSELLISLRLEPGEFERIKKSGMAAREKMISGNLRLVVSIAKKYQDRGVPLMDLIQEGSIGLARGVEKFDPERGYKFSTYAYWWTFQGISRSIPLHDRTIRLPVHLVEKINRLKRFGRELSQELGRSAKMPELAERMGLSEQEVSALLVHHRSLLSLDLLVGDDQDTRLVDQIASPEPSPQETLEKLDIDRALNRYLSRLSDRESDLLRRRFGIGYDRHSLSQIGAIYGLSRERTRQLQNTAIQKIRNAAAKNRFTDRELLH
jgi:RNA polymerase nonessential primary-like sigma factor